MWKLSSFSSKKDERQSQLETSEQFFRVQVSPHVEYLHRVAYRFCGNKSDAEDLVHDLLVKIYPKCSAAMAIKNLRAWLTTSLYHLYIDQVRRHNIAPVEFSDKKDLYDVSTNHLTPELETELSETIIAIEKVFAQLNADQRAIITLHDIEGYTLVELETMLDTPLGTLKSRMHRARARLKALMENEPQGTFSSPQPFNYHER